MLPKRLGASRLVYILVIVLISVKLYMNQYVFVLSKPSDSGRHFVSLLFGLSSRGGTWVKFCWLCAAGISEPLPNYSLFLVYFVAKYKPHVSHFWANDFLTLKVPKKCDPILVTLLEMLEKATPL